MAVVCTRSAQGRCAFLFHLGSTRLSRPPWPPYAPTIAQSAAKRGPPCKDCSPPPTSNPSPRAPRNCWPLAASVPPGRCSPPRSAWPWSACLADLGARLALRANDARCGQARTGRSRRSRPRTPRPAHAARRVAPSGRRHRRCRARRRRSRRARPLRSRRQGAARRPAAGARARRRRRHCLAEAVAADPANPGFAAGLAAAQEVAGRP